MLEHFTENRFKHLVEAVKDINNMARLDQEKQNKEQPRRIRYAITQIENLGVDVLFKSETEIQFLHKEEKVNFFPYSGWHTGRSIVDGRGIDNLLKQLI